MTGPADALLFIVVILPQHRSRPKAWRNRGQMGGRGLAGFTGGIGGG
jgi:hypothetical protein